MPRKRLVEHILPANNTRFIEKAAASDAEIIFLDLEDAVAASAKNAARQIVINAVKSTDFKGKELYVRPNNLRTKWAAGDYFYVIKTLVPVIQGVVLPKVIGLEDIKLVDEILIALELEAGLKRGSLKIEALIETPKALLGIDPIAEYMATSGRAGSLILGFVDYLAATGGRPQAREDQFLYFLYPKKRIIEAAKKWGLDAFDGITIHVKNYEVTKRDAMLSAQMGFTGKWSLHPEQIRAIHDANREQPFCESRIIANRPVTRETKPYPLAELKRLAESENPILSPIEASKKQVKARRSIWISPKETAPKEVDECAVVSPSASAFVKIGREEDLKNAYEMARASPQVEGLIFDIPGKNNDFEAKGALIAACGAADVDAIDGPAEAGKAEEEAQHASIMGFSGKVALTSNEAAIYNKVFSPSPQTIERALDIIELYLKADLEHGLGAIIYKEELVDEATIKVERRVLAVAEKAKLFTSEQAQRYVRLLLQALEEGKTQEGISALKKLYLLGSSLVEPVWNEWRSHEELAHLISGPPTVGIAVKPERFERLRKVWGSPELSPIPEEHKVLEFILQVGDCSIDILTPSGEGGPLSQFLAKQGEGIQQVELLTSDIEKAAKILRDIGFQPIYEKAKVGSHGTLVNFVLATKPDNGKILVELVQENL